MDVNDWYDDEDVWTGSPSTMTKEAPDSLLRLGPKIRDFTSPTHMNETSFMNDTQFEYEGGEHENLANNILSVDEGHFSPDSKSNYDTPNCDTSFGGSKDAPALEGEHGE